MRTSTSRHEIDLAAMRVARSIRTVFIMVMFFLIISTSVAAIYLYKILKNTHFVVLKNELVWMVKEGVSQLEPEYFSLTPLVKFFNLHQVEIYNAIQIGFAIGMIFTGVFIAIIFRFIRVKGTEDYVRGSQFTSEKKLSKNLKKRAIFGSKYGYKIGEKNLFIPEEYNWLGYLICGRPGTGKSNAIRRFLEQDRKQNNKAFIIDIDGEYWRQFGRPDIDIVLSLGHEESEYWDFWCEDIPMEKMAQYLVQEGSGNAFFWKAARFVVGSLLEQSGSLEEFKNHIKSADTMISKYLSEVDPQAVNILGSPGSGQSTGVWGNSSLDLKFVQDLGLWPNRNGKKDPFSIMEWSKKKDDSWVFVVAKSSEIESIRPMIATWFNIAIFGCLSRRESDFEKMEYRPIRIVLDELKSLGKLDELSLAGERLRKHRGSLICGYQNNSQLDSIYGKIEARNIKDVIQNKIIYSVGEGDAQEEISRMLGEKEVEIVTANTQLGHSGSSESIGHKTERKRIILPSEVGNLKREECIVKISNFDPVKTKIPYKKFAEIADPLSWKSPSNSVGTSLCSSEKIYKDGDEQVPNEQVPEKEEKTSSHSLNPELASKESKHKRDFSEITRSF